MEKLHIGTGIYSATKGNVVDITYSYKLRGYDGQVWRSWWCEHAFYLNLDVAQKNNLRIYVLGLAGWKEGPIPPDVNYKIRNSSQANPPD